MKNLLIDVDSKIPNLALMKLARILAPDFEFMRLGLKYYKRKKKKIVVDCGKYDKVFASCVFTTNKDFFELRN